jgi:hypothetical protein
VGVAEALAPDRHGNDRRVFQFRLAFSDDGLATRLPRRPRNKRQGTVVGRSYRRRAFDPKSRPNPPVGTGHAVDPDELLARREKANQRHFQILCDLQSYLEEAAWHDIEEIPAAIDLLAKKRGTGTVLFEAKTISASNERSQVRSGMAQLLEYRIFFGAEKDKLCLVTDRPIGQRRLKVLDALGIAHVYLERGELTSSEISTKTQIF